MSDYRTIEVIVSVIGKNNAATEEPPDKLISMKINITINENLTIEDISSLILKAIRKFEDEN